MVMRRGGPGQLTTDSDLGVRTLGIILCSEKNDAMAKITLREDNEQILAARYQMYLPTEEELRAELEREREEAERTLRLAAPEPDDGES